MNLAKKLEMEVIKTGILAEAAWEIMALDQRIEAEEMEIKLAQAMERTTGNDMMK